MTLGTVGEDIPDAALSEPIHLTLTLGPRHIILALHTSYSQSV